jgi:hypothetical protein
MMHHGMPLQHFSSNHMQRTSMGAAKSLFCRNLMEACEAREMEVTQSKNNQKINHASKGRDENIWSVQPRGAHGHKATKQAWVHVWYLVTHEINLQAHKYRCRFHLRVFHGYRNRGNVCVLTSFWWSKDTPRYEALGERIPMDSSIDKVKGRSLTNLLQAPTNPWSVRRLQRTDLDEPQPALYPNVKDFKGSTRQSPSTIYLYQTVGYRANEG